MQEESKNPSNRRSFESYQNSEKIQKKNLPSWNFKYILNCCRDPDAGTDPHLPRKHVNSLVTTHYSNRGPTSFVNNIKTCENLNVNIPENSFPWDVAFLLGKGANKIICKISKVNLALKSSTASDISSDSKRSKLLQDIQNKKANLKSSDNMEMANGEQKALLSPRDNYNFSRHQIFSMYGRGIQVEKSDWNEITPEVIAQYIARKLKDEFIIDAMSGYGGNTIQFAKRCPYVVGVEIEGYKLKKAKHNAGIYQISNNIDFIHADFFSLKRLRADVVFLAPSEVSQEGNKEFSLEKNISPCLTKLVRHSLTMAESVCLLLPPWAEIEEIGQVFTSIYSENPMMYNNMNYSIKIELLYIEDNLVSTLVHFGGNNSITLDEQRDVLFNTMSQNDSPNCRAMYPQPFVHRLFSYVGIPRSLMIISSIEDELDSENRLEESVFDVFIDSLKEKKIVTPEVIKQLYQPGQEGFSPVYASALSSGKLNKLLGSWDMKISGCDGNNALDLSSKNRSIPSKNMGIGNSYQSSHKGAGNFETPQGTDGTNSRSENAKNSYGKGGQPHSNADSEIKELNSGSLEVSDMAVSSYSMKSAALLDSDSENATAEYRLSLLEEQGENKSPETVRSSISKKHHKKLKVPTKRDKSSLVEPGQEKNEQKQRERPASGSFIALKVQSSKDF